jgi:hypothetical protein
LEGDIGDPTFNLVRLRNETHISLTLEHVHGEVPVNGDQVTESALMAVLHTQSAGAEGFDRHLFGSTPKAWVGGFR